MDKNEIKKLEETVAACNRCGFCTSYCPTYLATGKESHSPRGRNQTFRAMLEGKITNLEETKDIIDTCLLCGECTSVCFSEVPTAQLMVQARSMINDQVGIPKQLQFILTQVLPNPKKLYWFLKAAFLGKKLGISWLLRKTGLLAKTAPPLAAADALVDDVPLKFLLDYKEAEAHHETAQHKEERDFFIAQMKASEIRKKGVEVPEALRQKTVERPTRPKIAFMPVCGSQYLRPSIGLATVKLLEKLNLDFVIPDLICCGLPAASYGVTDQVRAMAKENLDRLERGRYESIVTDDSSCTAHMKDYSKYFQNDKVWADRALALTSKMREFSSFLVQWGLLDKLQKVTWTGGPVAYHDPCKAQYSQHVTEPPRELIGSIKGMKLIPVADADQCCGGGGTYSFVQPELSQEVLAKKIKNIVETKAKIVVTSSASCLIQLTAGLKEAAPNVQVLHLAEFLVRAFERGR